MMLMTSLTSRAQCREAVEVYARVPVGEITDGHRFGDGPPDMPVDPKYADWRMH